MAVANGFGKTVTSGSVFMYDTGDTVNSYKGKPTTNRFSTEITDPTLDSLAIENGAGSNPQLGSGGTCAVALFNGEKVLAINRGTSSGVYYENRVYWSIPLTTGNYYSWSAWVYSTVAGPILQLEYYGGDYNWGVAQSYNTHTGTGWERLYAYANAVASSNTQTYCFIYINTNNTIYVKDFQLENQIYPTQFTTGTRSATQGLLPLVGNSTIDLSNVSFDSNAQIVFDGTDDRIDIGNFSVPYLTVSTWVYKTASTTNQGICRKENGWAVSQYNGTLQVAPGTSWNFYDTGYVIPLNTWVNIVYTYSGTEGSDSQSVYVNGNRIYTSSAGTGPISSNSNTINVGYDDNNWFWNGYIANTIIYNRALSSSEVQQNYNKYKTRFNLS